ncbi:hypothetical protein [Fibrisoma montanum]|uniref:hypothetical protein n=1 Tax=Fibrisoma montanum TaxID=2305895 RepID=UPI001E365E9E|nr:hypothetical protein [Fibrisoma montanum]
MKGLGIFCAGVFLISQGLYLLPSPQPDGWLDNIPGQNQPADSWLRAKADPFTTSFVRVSPKNPLYFELSNGQAYIPIGPNICWARDMGLMKTYFRKLSENGGNYARVWLSHPLFEIERQFGRVDSSSFQKIDTVLELASRYRIKVKFCFEHFRQIDTTRNFFNKALYHQANGGPFADMAGYIQSDNGRATYLNKVDLFRQRYGDHPAVFGWELWNEMNAIRSAGLYDWNAYMLPEVHRKFPKNLVMQSLGSFDSEKARPDYRFINSLKANDVAQIHRYLDKGGQLAVVTAPMDVLASNAVAELRSYGLQKPMLLAEVGAVKPKHTGPSELYPLDKAGMLLHDMLFAPFFSGAAGTGMAWHWDSYIDKNNLWYHYQRFTEAIKGVDPVDEQFVPVTIPHPTLRIYGLSGRKTLLLWCRDAENDWQQELEKGRAPALRQNLTVNVDTLLSAKQIRQVTTYDPWQHKTQRARRSAAVQLPDFTRSIVVRINRM